jgi:hypothetical protein
MITLGITVAAFGSGMTGRSATQYSARLHPGRMLAALGAATVATLGVLIVRILNAPSQKPAAPSLRDPSTGRRREEGRLRSRPCCPSSNPRWPRCSGPACAT